MKESKFLDIKNIDQSAEAAIYYGFAPINTPVVEKTDRERAKELKDGEPYDYIGSNDRIKNTAEERSAMLRTYLETNLCNLPQPLMLVYKNLIGDDNKNSGKHRRLGLEVIGSTKGLAEALVIKTAWVILSDNGYKNLIVELNSIGDRESNNRFLRELTAYYRKNINHLSNHCRQAFKKDPYFVLNCQNDKCPNFKSEAPKAIAFLSEESREHFKSVLEYLESLGIPYHINDYLLADRRYASGTIFEIKQQASGPRETDLSLAVGFRLDQAAKKMGFKKDCPLVCAKLDFKCDESKKTPRIKKTSVFFIQLGDEAKHQSLKVIDILRQANIYISHSLGRDKLSGQMALAEKSKVPYILIMGKKEAVENSVIVRNMATRSQITVKIDELASYIKNLVK